MRAAKRIALLVYLLACSFSVGSLCLAQMGPYTDRFADLLGMRPYRIAVGVCLAIVAVQLLVTLGRVLFAPRPVRDLVYPESTMGIEVSLDALRSSVRAAVEETGELLVESVGGRASSSHPESAVFEVAVVPLVDEGLAQVATAAQERAMAACQRLVGMPVAQVRVRVLPSKTTVVRKESES